MPHKRKRKMNRFTYSSLNEADFRALLPPYFAELYASDTQGAPSAEETARTLEIILELHAAHRLSIIMCYCDGQPAGFAIYELGTRGRPHSGFIAEFYITPPHRRSGAGRSMARIITNAFRLSGAQSVWLTTDTADSFWRGCGFVPTGEICADNDCPIYELKF